MELRLEIEEGLLDLLLAVEVDEEELDCAAGLLLVPAPHLLLPELEAEALSEPAVPADAWSWGAPAP